jgi:AcrR family transcriptional regulator
MHAVTERKTAEERREAVLAEALVELANKGYDGASTDAIARRAGISQPYLFRLFGTKRDLFAATVARCFAQTLEMFQRAAEGLRGEDALRAIGDAYRVSVTDDPSRLRAQMQAYAACDDAEIGAVVRRGFGELVQYVERISGLPPENVSRFFATGMLINVIASMNVLESGEPWAARLMAGCKESK